MVEGVGINILETAAETEEEVIRGKRKTSSSSIKWEVRFPVSVFIDNVKSDPFPPSSGLIRASVSWREVYRGGSISRSSRRANKTYGGDYEFVVCFLSLPI